MANLFELLPEEDREKIEWYIHSFAGLGGDSSDMEASLDYILRFWTYNKQNLYKMLGDNLIISRKVSYSRTYEDMSDDYYDYFVCKKWTIMRQVHLQKTDTQQDKKEIACKIGIISQNILSTHKNS